MRLGKDTVTLLWYAGTACSLGFLNHYSFMKNWLIWKDPDAGKDWGHEEMGTIEDEMVGCHHWLDGHEFEQALWFGDGQGSLEGCSPWGHKELDTTEQLNWIDVPSCFSHVWLCATPGTATHQAPLSMGFSRQEYWSGLPCAPSGDFPNPGIEPVSPALQGDSLLLSHWGSPLFLYAWRNQGSAIYLRSYSE